MASMVPERSYFAQTSKELGELYDEVMGLRYEQHSVAKKISEVSQGTLGKESKINALKQKEKTLKEQSDSLKQKIEQQCQPTWKDKFKIWKTETEKAQRLQKYQELKTLLEKALSEEALKAWQQNNGFEEVEGSDLELTEADHIGKQGLINELSAILKKLCSMAMQTNSLTEPVIQQCVENLFQNASSVTMRACKDQTKTYVVEFPERQEKKITIPEGLHIPDLHDRTFVIEPHVEVILSPSSISFNDQAVHCQAGKIGTDRRYVEKIRWRINGLSLSNNVELTLRAMPGMVAGPKTVRIQANSLIELLKANMPQEE